jgi:hypothetical protein
MSLVGYVVNPATQSFLVIKSVMVNHVLVIRKDLLIYLNWDRISVSVARQSVPTPTQDGLERKASAKMLL